MHIGLNLSADVFQGKLSKLFPNMHFVLVCIDDILIITKGTYEDHLKAIKLVLKSREDWYTTKCG